MVKRAFESRQTGIYWNVAKKCEIETWDSAFAQNLYLMLPHNDYRAAIKRNETVKCVNT